MSAEKPLAYRNNDRPDWSFTRLPFVSAEADEDRHHHFWDIPLRGGYFGGEITGKAMGFAFLRYAMKCPQGELDDDALASVVISMSRLLAQHDAYQYKQNETVAAASIRAQMQAFLEVVQVRAIKDTPTEKIILNLTEAEICEMANKGLELDDKACQKFWDVRNEITEQEKIFEPHRHWPYG